MSGSATVDDFYKKTSDRIQFSREALENIRHEKDKVRNGAKEYATYNYDGELEKGQDATGLAGEEVMIKYTNYQSMANAENYSYSKFPVDLDKTQPSGEYDNAGVQKRVRELYQWWNKGPFKRMLVAYVRKIEVSPRIDRVICIGLGSLKAFDHRIIHHLAACEVAKQLEQMYSESGISTDPPTKVSIQAQDPFYTQEDRHLFEIGLFEPKIEVIEDPAAFLDFNSTSFIVAIQLDCPVRQIIADLLLEQGDRCPAAVWWACEEGGSWVPDSSSPRVEKMMERFQEIGYFGVMPDANWLKQSKIYIRK